MNSPSTLSLVLFAVAWAIGIYGVNCLIARQVKRINLKQAALHLTSMSVLGIVGEIAIGSIYEYIVGKPLWNYTIFPVHHSYTSLYAIFLWGIYGFHLNLLHGTLKTKKIESIHHLAFIFCLEAILIEASVNSTYKLCFNQYIYYYFPNDLWHLTSIQTLPFYLLAGYIIVSTFKRFEKDPVFFTLMSVALIWVLAFLA